MMTDPASYDAWYQTPRGSWIGETEYRLLRRQLDLHAGETLLDAGCGSGYFSRRFAGEGHDVVGLDMDSALVAYARNSATPALPCVVADMTAMPFADLSFDCVISVTALCFVADERRALQEMLRVTRRRFALGLLNRNSLLYASKRRTTGSYADARWHRPNTLRTILNDLPVGDVQIATAVFLPDARLPARWLENIIPGSLPWGSFIAVTGNKIHRSRT